MIALSGDTLLEVDGKAVLVKGEPAGGAAPVQSSAGR